MNREQAEFVKQRRLGAYTWRAIAYDYHAKWGGDGSSQFEGEYLCLTAAAVLGEDSDGWDAQLRASRPVAVDPDDPSPSPSSFSPSVTATSVVWLDIRDVSADTLDAFQRWQSDEGIFPMRGTIVTRPAPLGRGRVHGSRRIYSAGFYAFDAEAVISWLTAAGLPVSRFPSPPDPIVAVHLRLASDQTGRAFLLSSRLARVSTDDLASALEQRFVEEDDAARLSLLRDELAAPAVTVETFPGEETPIAHYAYVRSTIRPGESLFACVLASRALVEHLAQDPPHVVFETATFQAVDHPSSVAFEAGLESWARRVFPGLVTPTSFRLVGR